MREPLRRALVFGIVAAIALVIASLPRSLTAQSDTDQHDSPEVRELSMVGVRHVNRGELEQSIATQATECKSILLEPFCVFSHSPLFVRKHYLDRTELKRDVLRVKVFYWKRGFRSTQVDTSVTRKGDGVKVTFTIAEGPPTLVSSVVVAQAESVLTPKDLRQNILLREKEPLNLLALDSSHVLLRQELWEKGYSDAVLRDTVIVSDDQRTGTVRLSIDPRWRAVVETITVHGNEEITPRTIHNMITLRAGAVYRRSDLLTSQRNLYASSLFRRAVISVADTADSAKHVDIALQEAPFHDVRLSGGFNTVDFGQFQARLTNYNWLGGARRLDLTGVVSNLLAPKLNGTGIFQNVTGNLSDQEAAPYLRPNYELGANITQPWFHDPRNSIGVGLFGHRRSAPGIYIDKGYGVTGSFTRELAPRSPLSIVYRYELTEVDAGDIYFCVNYGVCEQGTIGALRGRHAMSPISIDLFTDRTDNTLSPTTGYQARLDLEHASAFTLSKFRYNRISGEASRYMPVGHAVLAGRIRFGWVSPLGSTANALGQFGSSSGDILHPSKRFYAGGSQSVRGYGENQLGPRVLTIDPAILERPVDDQGHGAGCNAASIADGSCNPTPVSSQYFQPRPTGGTSLIEANLEYRFPITGPLGGAVFVDGAFVGEGALQDVTSGTGAVTPGFGVRYQSPVGPIRVDLGIRPTLQEDLTVITEATNPDGTTRIVKLATVKRYNPIEGSGGWIHKILNRLSLHLSIGQAF
jgi:outer membrane protein assembly factor BamA